MFCPEVSIPRFGEGKMEGTKPEEKQKYQQNFDSIEGRDWGDWRRGTDGEEEQMEKKTLEEEFHYAIQGEFRIP